MPDDTIESDLYGDGLLGEAMAPKRTGNLAERFLVPPFTVLSAREGFWQDRKRAWIALGIKSELGRGGIGTDIQTNAVAAGTPGGMVNAITRNFKDQAAPGGSLMPAMDYKNRERGNSTGKPIVGTSSNATPSVAPITLAPKPVTFAAPPASAPSAAQAQGTQAAVPQARATASAPQKAAVVAGARASRVAASPVLAQAAMPSSSWRPPIELPSLSGRKITSFAYDTETTGLNPKIDRMIGLSIAIDTDGPRLYLPFGHEGGDNLPEENVKRWLIDEVVPLRAEMVGAYLLFDLEMTAMWGVRFPNVTAYHDVQVAEPLIDEWLDKYSLDSLGTRYLGEGKSEVLLRAAAAKYGWTLDNDVKKNLHKLPARYVGVYAEADADLPMRVWDKQRKILEEQELTKIYEVERKLIPILLAMRLRGVPIDVPRAESLLEKLAKERDSRLVDLKRLAGHKAEFKATASLAPSLRDRGIPVPRTKATERFPEGQDSVTEALLNEHRGDALVNAVLAGRRVNTMATYVEKSILENVIDGRVYPTFNQLRREREDGGGRQGTIARFSCTDPNLQAVGKREKLADDLIDIDEEISSSIRRLFPSEPSERIQRCDMSQAEFRLTVNIAVGRGAEEARERYRKEPTLSFHKMCGELANIDPNDKSQYDKIKALNLGKSYGAQGPRIAKLLGVSTEEANIFIRRYEAALPFTVETFNAAKRAADERGFIRTILGRRQRFPLWEPANNRRGDGWRPALPRDRAMVLYGQNIVRAHTYKALNRYDQASCADIFKKGLVDIYEAGIFDVIGAPLLLVHDELVDSIPDTPEGRQAAEEIPRIMGTCVTMSIPLLIDVSYGPTWGDCA